MNKRIVSLSPMFVWALVVLMSCLFGAEAWADPAPAAQAPALQSIAPQVDPTADQPRKAPQPSTLQGSVKHNESFNVPSVPKKRALKGGADSGGLLGKRHGARTDAGNPLNGSAKNKQLNSDITSGFGIIGVKFVLAVGKPPIINRVFPGTPAATVGLMENDAIVAVDGVPTFGLTKEEVYDLIIGAPGTSVSVSIMRAGDVKVVSCTRMDINELTDPVVRRDYLMAM